MDEITVRLGREGQITLPPEVRSKLRLRPGDEVAFDVKGIGVRMRKAFLTFEDTFGSVQPRNPVTDIDEAIRQAKEDKVLRHARKLANQELRATKPPPEY